MRHAAPAVIVALNDPLMSVFSPSVNSVAMAGEASMPPITAASALRRNNVFQPDARSLTSISPHE